MYILIYKITVIIEVNYKGEGVVALPSTGQHEMDLSADHPH